MSRQKAILFGPLPPPYGGVSVFMSSVRDACLERGAEVWSYTGDDGDKRVTRLSHRTLGHIRRLGNLPAGTRMIDSSHFHLEYPNRLLLASWLRAKRRRKFYWIKVCHDGSLPARYVRMSDGEKDRVAKAVMAVDELIVTSPALVDFFRVEFDMAANFISPLLPTAIPSHKTNTIPARNIITSVGAFIPEYGFDHLATAVERLRVEGRGISLTLIDGAFIRDDAYRDSVLRDRPWITVHEGVPRSTVGDLIAGSAAFVRPVEHESYGLSRVEAILANVPVIATNVGETRGMLTYEFGDIGALTTLIGKALIDHSDNELARWAEIYEQEATQNLATYLSVITGEPDA